MVDFAEVKMEAPNSAPVTKENVEEESEGFVVLSQVRTGLKREFQFALRSQNELGGSLSRTRVRKSRLTELQKVESEESDEESSKRLNFGSQRRDSDKVNEFSVVMEDEEKNNEIKNGTAVWKGKGKEKESEVKKVPTKLRELLDTGLLEDLKVKYVRKKAGTDKWLAGIIKGCGVLCFCADCKGIQVVTPNTFELHAGSGNKRPSDYMYLENGRSLRDVITACRSAKLKDVEPVILNAISSLTDKKLSYCTECKAPISDAGFGRSALLCNTCSQSEVSQVTPSSSAVEFARSGAQAPPSSSCSTAPKTSLPASRNQGKITLKDLRLHRLVFQHDSLPDGAALGYYNDGEKKLSGHKRGSGIFCDCCQSEISPSQFEAHAGHPSRRKPYLNIYTSNGVSLHELSLKLSKTSDFATDENDDLCSVCHEPGNLLCCDGCPRACHTECVNLSKVPENKWYCKYCEDNFQKDRFSEKNPNAIAAGRVPGVDPMEQITNCRIRIVKTDSQDDGGCVICREQDFCKTGFGPRTVMICDQCEKEYHVGCMREHNMQDLKDLPAGDWFCCSTCESIHASLKKLMEEGEKKLPSHCIAMVKKKLIEKELVEANLDVTWRVLNGRMPDFNEKRLLFAEAVSVFHEQFDPIFYGELKQNLIPHLVYGKNFKEKELRGMCCAVISVNSKIVSCAVFRVFGEEIVEVPLVSTSKDAEGKGYFQCLYSCMERLFEDLGVKNILLPAAEEKSSLWINKFGFSEMRNEEIDYFSKRYGLMKFDGTSMLHKLVPRTQNPEIDKGVAVDQI